MLESPKRASPSSARNPSADSTSEYSRSRERDNGPITREIRNRKRSRDRGENTEEENSPAKFSTERPSDRASQPTFSIEYEPPCPFRSRGGFSVSRPHEIAVLEEKVSKTRRAMRLEEIV